MIQTRRKQTLLLRVKRRFRREDRASAKCERMRSHSFVSCAKQRLAICVASLYNNRNAREGYVMKFNCKSKRKSMTGYLLPFEDIVSF